MSSGKRPEFFLDRSLGVRFANALTAVGWQITRLADEYPDDAQFVPDETWIAHGCERGRVLLTKDKMIRFRVGELASLEGIMFCLANGNLSIADAIDRFLAAEQAILRIAERGRPGFWLVYESGRLDRKWP